MYKITYLSHSGIKIEADNGDVLIFDYYTQGGKFAMLGEEDVKGRNVYIFATHAHADHFDSAVLKLAEYNPDIKYVLSDDIRTGKAERDITCVSANKSYKIGGLEVLTLKSNDEGVAFIVKCGERVFFHMGDLNHWHWNGESDEFNSLMKDIFVSEVSSVKDLCFDAVFVPVDPRLEDKYRLSLDYVMNNLNVKRAMPIHFWRRYDIGKMLVQDGVSYIDRIIMPEKEGWSICIDD